MKKQFAFTLIELMVVMAIIAILGTVGLSAYTGYIKKARDTTRIADISAMNTIVMSALSVNGGPPADITALNTLVSATNNGQQLVDPLGTAPVCFTDTGATATGACGYTYSLCDGGAGYLITAKFESKSNINSYTTKGSIVWYNIGSCAGVDWGGGSTPCATVWDACPDGTVYVSASLRTTPHDEGPISMPFEGVNLCTGKGSGWRVPTVPELTIMCEGGILENNNVLHWASGGDTYAGGTGRGVTPPGCALGTTTMFINNLKPIRCVKSI